MKDRFFIVEKNVLCFDTNNCQKITLLMQNMSSIFERRMNRVIVGLDPLVVDSLDMWSRFVNDPPDLMVDHRFVDLFVVRVVMFAMGVVACGFLVVDVMITVVLGVSVVVVGVVGAVSVVLGVGHGVVRSVFGVVGVAHGVVYELKVY